MWQYLFICYFSRKVTAFVTSKWLSFFNSFNLCISWIKFEYFRINKSFLSGPNWNGKGILWSITEKIITQFRLQQVFNFMYWSYLYITINNTTWIRCAPIPELTLSSPNYLCKIWFKNVFILSLSLSLLLAWGVVL